MAKQFAYMDVGACIRAITNDEIKLTAYIEEAVDQTARYVERRAKELVQFDTGFLKSSIQRDYISPVEQTVTANTDYAGYLEYGTSRMRPYPYMTPAANEAQDQMNKFIINAIKKAL